MLASFVRRAGVISLPGKLAFGILTLVASANGDDLSPVRAPVHSAQVGPGIVVFSPTGYDPARMPSFALAAPVKETGPAPANWKLTPTFTGTENQAGAAVSLPEKISLYGTGEVVGPLRRNGRSTTLWNTDNFNYKKHDGASLYQAHPWVLGVRADGTAFGVLFDTTWKATLRTDDDRISLESEGLPFRVFVVDRESPQAVVRGLAELTGTIPLPPKWALGFNQCRYSYYPDARVRAVADEFRARHLPCDVIWVDIDYMDGFRIFTFDKNRFPDPQATNEYLHGKDFHSVWMIDPGVKIDPQYAVYQQGSERHLWTQNKDGGDDHGAVWPGECVFPDFTMPETRAWWAGLYKDFVAQGIDGVWNDMNEPSVFSGPDGSLPEEDQHRGGGELPPGPHRMYHNVFGILMTQATRQGILAARPDKRPFVLTRSNYLGGQRYAATWTGDNAAETHDLVQSIPMSINLGLSGQPISGADIGGYSGKGNAELYANWLAVGVFYPFSRAHAEKGTPDREPWSYGPEVEAVSRTALERRYRLLPYLYTRVQAASISGEPIMQPVFFADPKDEALRSEDQAFLFGPDLLVVPRWATAPKLPKGIWREVTLLDNGREQDGYQPTLKMRGGAILPLGAVVQSTAQSDQAALTLRVCLDAEGRAEGSLYEDAGEGFAYQQGQYAWRHFTARRERDQVSIRQDSTRGDLLPPSRDVAVEVITDDGVVRGQGNLAEGITIKMTP